jgi:spermidine/putrescine transport system substrate-binding protein
MPPKIRSGYSAWQLSVSRRRFLQQTAAAGAGVFLTNCAKSLSSKGSATQSGAVSGQDAKTLHIYTWADYTDVQLLRDFQDKTGIKAVVDVYDSNETMLAKLQSGGGSAYSIIYPGDYMVTQMVTLGLLTPLDRPRIQGLDNLRQPWQDPAYDRGNQHSVPTNWGTTGLIYDPQKLGFELKRWQDLWENAADMPRQVTMVNDVREVLGATLLALGHSFNTTDERQIKAAYEQLVKFKPAIAAFLTNGWEDQVSGGDIRVAMGYSPNAVKLIAEQPQLTYLIPETGASMWSDTIAIPKTAPNVDAAYEWLNFTLNPEVSKGLVERLKLATPNQKAFDLLPQDLQTNRQIFPDAATLSKCQIPQPVPAATAAVFDRYWTQLTSG